MQVPRGKSLSSYLKPKNSSVSHRVPLEERRTVKEQVIQKEIIDYLRSCGAWVTKIDAGRLVGSGDKLALVPTDPGIPDIIACIGGMFLAIEVKSAKSTARVSADQLRHLRRIREFGGYAIVSHSVTRVREYLLACMTDPQARVTFPITGDLI